MPCHARHVIDLTVVRSRAAAARVNVFQINNRVCIGERVSRADRQP
jgi:hypothetical protein